MESLMNSPPSSPESTDPSELPTQITTPTQEPSPSASPGGSSSSAVHPGESISGASGESIGGGSGAPTGGASGGSIGGGSGAPAGGVSGGSIAGGSGTNDIIFSIRDEPMEVITADMLASDRYSFQQKLEMCMIDNRLANTQVTRMFKTLGETVALEVRAIKDGINKGAEVVEEVRTEVAGVKQKVEDIDREIKNMKEGGAENARAAIYFSETGKKVWPIIPLLVNGKKGIAGWVPVDHVFTVKEEVKEVQLVVLSVPVTQWLLAKYDDGLSCIQDIGDFLKSNLKRYMYPKKMKFSEFKSIIMKTPFRPYVSTPRSTFAVKSNAGNYIIMEAAYFKSLMADIDKFFPDRPNSLPASFPDTKIPNNIMHQDFALLAQSRQDNRTCNIPVFGGRLTFEERAACPAMLTTWWKECYKSGMVNYFGMETEGTMGHIVDGQYVKNPESGWSVKSFEQILEVKERYPIEDSAQEGVPMGRISGKRKKSTGKGKGKARKKR